MEVRGAASSADIQSVLAQMRELRAQAGQSIQPLEAGRETDAAQGPRRVDFGATLKSAIDSVNEQQQISSAAQNDFITGKRSDLVNVMIEGQKSSLGFQAMVQVRNRMISAYQDIMNMPI